MKQTLIAFACAGLMATGCATTKTSTPRTTARALSWTVEQFVSASRSEANDALKSESRDAKRDAATRGIEYAERCIERAPEEGACYYYRAINTGLYYQAHVIGYQTGVKKMIDDCNQVIRLDPNYDYGGAYRILGELYTRLPQTTVRGEGITRNLDKAEGFLRQALRINTDYPENHLLLAETLLAQEKFPEALESLTRAKELAPKWKHDDAYQAWQTASRNIERRIAKKNN